MADRYYPANAMQTENPGSTDAFLSKGKSEIAGAAATWKANVNGFLTNVGPTEGDAAAMLRDVNNGIAAAATGEMPSGFTTRS